MPDKDTLARARRDKRQGKSPSTQAGEFVREEIHHIREGKHGARSAKQAIAIGLSKARKAGVALPAAARDEEDREQAAQAQQRDLGGAFARDPRCAEEGADGGGVAHGAGATGAQVRGQARAGEAACRRRESGGDPKAQRLS